MAYTPGKNAFRIGVAGFMGIRREHRQADSDLGIVAALGIVAGIAGAKASMVNFEFQGLDVTTAYTGAGPAGGAAPKPGALLPRSFGEWFPKIRRDA